MSDEKKVDPFKPQQPHIPGVPEGVKAANPPAPPKVVKPPVKPAGAPKKEKETEHMPVLWVALIVAACLVCVGFAWWGHHATPKEEVLTPEVEIPAPAAEENPKPAERLPEGPGTVATTMQLEKVWSSQRFIFRNPISAEQVPAMVVHLPGGIYWGFSMREPFGTCELEYVTDLNKLAQDYHYRADHPMVGDPCNHAVFDLMKYGSGPNGLVRGEIVQGAAVRPPLAIEMRTKGAEVIAVRIE